MFFGSWTTEQENKSFFLNQGSPSHLRICRWKKTRPPLSLCIVNRRLALSLTLPSFSLKQNPSRTCRIPSMISSRGLRSPPRAVSARNPTQAKAPTAALLVAARRSLVCSAAAVPSVGRPDAQVVTVLGTQWGDEGKGKLVDILARDFDVVARAQVGRRRRRKRERRAGEEGGREQRGKRNEERRTHRGKQKKNKKTPFFSFPPPNPLPGRRQRRTHHLRRRGQKVQASFSSFRDPPPEGRLHCRQRRRRQPPRAV